MKRKEEEQRKKAEEQARKQEQRVREKAVKEVTRAKKAKGKQPVTCRAKRGPSTRNTQPSKLPRKRVLLNKSMTANVEFASLRMKRIIQGRIVWLVHVEGGSMKTAQMTVL